MNLNSDNRTRFETGLGPMTDRILNQVATTLSSDKVLEPLTSAAKKRVMPYVKIMGIMYIILIVLLLIIIYLLIMIKRK